MPKDQSPTNLVQTQCIPGRTFWMEMFLRSTITYASYGISLPSSAGQVEMLQINFLKNSVINGGFPYLVEVCRAGTMLIGTVKRIIKPFDIFPHLKEVLDIFDILFFLVCLSCWWLSVSCWSLWDFLNGVSFCICFPALRITYWSLCLLSSLFYSEVVFFSLLILSLYIF